MGPPLDTIDQGILYYLQQNSRQPITVIADELNLSDNTVRNRIKKLEENGIIEQYSIAISYDEANILHYYLFICTARVSERETLAAKAPEIPGVVEVVTVMTGKENVHVKAAAMTKQEITQIAHRLDELDLIIDREHLIWGSSNQPFSGFSIENEL